MHYKEFSNIRHRIGKTQQGLARLLCVSPKTVQRFEQGLSKIPEGTERQMLLCHHWEASKHKTLKPCWEIRNCPDKWRDSCTAWEDKIGHLCWFINKTFCQGEHQKSWERKFCICRECEVFTTATSKIGET